MEPNSLLPQLWQYLQQKASEHARSLPPRQITNLPARLPSTGLANLGARGLSLLPSGGGPVSSLASGGSLVPTGANGVPGGLGQIFPRGIQALLPGPSGAVSTAARSGLPALAESAGLPAVTSAAEGAGGAAAGGALGSILGPLGALLGSTKSANKGEKPMYVIDPMTGKMMPNPQAAVAGQLPPGSYGYGGGYQPAQPAPGMGGGPLAGAPQPAILLPMARPADLGMPLSAPRPASAPQAAPQQPTGPSTLQALLSFLNGGPGTTLNNQSTFTPPSGMYGFGQRS